MLRFHCFLAITSFLLTFNHCPAQVGNRFASTEPAKELKQKDTTDILEEVLNMQDVMPAPPVEFREGHIQPTQLTHFFELRESGYSIQLPFRGMTPSPTIYKSMVYVSGGFGSKQFFAFEAKTGKKIWGIDLDDDGPSSAVVEEDIVVFNTESCTIFAVEASTGKMIWSHWLGDPLMSTPTISNGKVFTSYPAAGHTNLQQQNIQVPDKQLLLNKKEALAGQTGRGGLQFTHVLVAFDLKSGEILWQKWIDGDIMSAPVAEGKELFVTTFPGTFYIFNQENGEILSAHTSRATSAPVIVERSVYMSQRVDKSEMAVTEQMATLDRKSSSYKKAGYSRTAPYLDQQVQNRSLFKTQSVADDEGNGFGSGAPASAGWEGASGNIGQSNVSSLQSFHGSRILPYRGFNYSTMGDEIICADTVSGKLLWKKKLKGDLEREGGFLATPPLIAGGRIIVATLNGNIILLDPDTGEEHSSYYVGEPVRYQPVVDEGNIYVTTTSGKIICIYTGDPSLDGWSSWGADAAHSNKGDQGKK